MSPNRHIDSELFGYLNWQSDRLFDFNLSLLGLLWLQLMLGRLIVVADIFVKFKLSCLLFVHTCFAAKLGCYEFCTLGFDLL